MTPSPTTYKLEVASDAIQLARQCAEQINRCLPGLRQVVAGAALAGVPVPCLSSSLDYIDSYRSGRLPQNLVQAMRDCFGSHTYERLDRPGSFHTEWIA